METSFSKVNKYLIWSVMGFLFSYGGLGIAKAYGEQAAQETVTFGIYTSVKPSEMIEKFTPVTKALESAMTARLKRSVAIKFAVAAKYPDGVKNISSGKVDFVRFGPASFIEALDQNANLSVLAIESKGGTKTDYGIICVKEDSSVKEVSDLKGKSFAFGDEMSTIGRYLSQQHLFNNGIRAADLSRYEYLGRHDAVGAAVGAGRFDAGALKEETFKKLKSSGTPLREIARFPNASQVWIAREGLAGDVFDALKQSLLELNDPRALKAIDADRMVAGSIKDFELVRSAMLVNPQFFNN